MKVEGGCLCGAVRYKSSDAPVRQAVCHCRDCQRHGGSILHVSVWVPKAGFTITKGELHKYETHADSGRKITRSFCPVCGSGITVEAELRPQHIAVKAGTLDDPSFVRPALEIYTRSKLPWVSIQGVERFDAMPPTPSQSKQ
jgi:hypothetical protein